MTYSIQNNGKGLVMIRVLAPECHAAAFLAFIEQKNRENVTFIKTVSSFPPDDYFINLQEKACTLFDGYIKDGFTTKTALSAINYVLKTYGFANISYDITKQILSKSGRLRAKKQLISAT